MTRPEPRIEPCEQCGEPRPLRHVWLDDQEYWLCADCRADYQADVASLRPPRPEP